MIAVLILFFSAGVFAAGQPETDAANAADEDRLLRVVSLAPNITEIIYALDKGDLLVGRTDYCNYPEQVRNVPSVGSIMEPSLEAIIELQPDVVFASTHAPREAAEQLEAAGIKVKYYYGPGAVEGVYDVISSVASDLDAEAAAKTLINSMKADYEKLKAKAAAIERRPTVYYVVGFGDGGDWTAGGDTFIGQMIEIAGGVNIAADASGWSYSLEKIMEADPDVIVIEEKMRDQFLSTPIYSNLTAVKNGRVYGINEDMINRQGPRLIRGIWQLNAVFSE